MEEPIGITLKAARINAGFEQKEASTRLNISVATLSSWENGKTHPSILQARELSRLYGVPLDHIIFLPIESNKN